MGVGLAQPPGGCKYQNWRGHRGSASTTKLLAGITPSPDGILVDVKVKEKPAPFPMRAFVRAR